jgi:hypothetical protein
MGVEHVEMPVRDGCIHRLANRAARDIQAGER